MVNWINNVRYAHNLNLLFSCDWVNTDSDTVILLASLFNYFTCNPALVSGKRNRCCEYLYEIRTQRVPVICHVGYEFTIKWRKKLIVRTDLISNSKIVERGKIDTPTHKYMTAHFNLKSIIHLYIRYIPVNTKSTSYKAIHLIRPYFRCTKIVKDH